MVRDEETGVTNGIGRGILGFLFSNRRIISTVRYLISLLLLRFLSFSLARFLVAFAKTRVIMIVLKQIGSEKIFATDGERNTFAIKLGDRSSGRALTGRSFGRVSSERAVIRTRAVIARCSINVSLSSSCSVLASSSRSSSRPGA